MAKTARRRRNDDSTPRERIDPVTNSEDPLLNYREAGEMLGRAPNTIRRWVEIDRILKAVRLPTGICCVRKSEIAKILSLDAFADREGPPPTGLR